MYPLYRQEEYDSSTSRCLLLVKCCQCNTPFTKQKRAIEKVLRGVPGHTGMFCSPQCSRLFQTNKFNLKPDVLCAGCTQPFTKRKSQIRSANSFCSRSCAASYNNKHKTHGTRRSKLEKWLEEQLTILYPELEIHFNKKDVIGSELDIYIPSLKLAFELNGIFHYEPIYGQPKLDQIRSNDVSKTKLCHEAKIDLCIIDTSGQKYVKAATSQKYLDIITSIINERYS